MAPRLDVCRGKFGSFGVSGNLSRFETDGYRAHSAARRKTLRTSRCVTRTNRALLAHSGVIDNALDQPDTQDPLGLTQEQLDADPTAGRHPERGRAQHAQEHSSRAGRTGMSSST